VYILRQVWWCNPQTGRFFNFKAYNGKIGTKNLKLTMPVHPLDFLNTFHMLRKISSILVSYEKNCFLLAFTVKYLALKQPQMCHKESERLSGNDLAKVHTASQHAVLASHFN